MPFGTLGHYLRFLAKPANCGLANRRTFVEDVKKGRNTYRNRKSGDPQTGSSRNNDVICVIYDSFESL